MTKEEKLKDLLVSADIYCYKKVLKRIINGETKKGQICYIASTPDGRDYNGYVRGTWRAYIWNGRYPELLFSNLKWWRAKVALKAYTNGTYKKVPSEIWENYITNGYNTRAGLFRTSRNKLDRIKKIARSHADYLGNEVSSSADHYARMGMRNKF